MKVQIWKNFSLVALKSHSNLGKALSCLQGPNLPRCGVKRLKIHVFLLKSALILQIFLQHYMIICSF